MRKKFNQLTREQRIKIEAYNNMKMPVKEIAEHIGCHISTIYRELKRGKTTKITGNDWKEKEIYSYDLGQIVHDDNKQKCGRKRILQNDMEFIIYVENMILNEKYSPEALLQTIEREKLKFRTKICRTTLYNYIKADVFPNIVLADCPYRKKKKAKQKKQKIQKRFAKGTSIDERPDSINKREEIGHWEMDSVVGPQGKGKKALLVFTERKTRKEIIEIVKNHTASEVIKTLNKFERKLGEKKFRKTFKSITVDNGTEFSDWEKMEKSRRNKKMPRTKIYYCYAYKSCERATNENHNRIIRRFFPKGTNFDFVTNKEIKKVEEWMNNYPRKILGWLTPNEMYCSEINV